MDKAQQIKTLEEAISFWKKTVSHYEAESAKMRKDILDWEEKLRAKKKGL